MAKARTKTWADKLNARTEAKIEVLPKAFGGMPTGARMLISTPAAVRDYMAAQPKGCAGTIATMRLEMAKAARADGTCPLTGSIFARIAAEAALEEMTARNLKPAQITPFWRVIEPKSALAKKLTCGPEFIEEMRAAEAKQAKR
jgi:hypothetical protein